jgi:GNAT superfamily N-acetyltransferase
MSILERIEVNNAGWADKDAIELRARQQKEVRAMSTPEPGQIPTAEDVPVFLVLTLDGQPIACGGLRPLSPSEGDSSREVEVKRMYVVPELRGKDHGVSGFLMAQLESHALENGWTTTKVETGRDIEHARRFYTRHGYTEIPSFGHYVDATNSVCYEKTLSR